MVVVSVVGGGENFPDGEISKTTTVSPLQFSYHCFPIPTLCNPCGYIQNPTSPDPQLKASTTSHRRTNNANERANEQIYTPSYPPGRSPAEHAVTRHQLSNTQKKKLAAWTTPYGFPVSSQGVVTLGEGLVTGA